MEDLPKAPKWLIGLACAELVVALAARLTAAGGFCPLEGGVFGCSAVVRPRVSQLGPVAVGDLGILGAWLALTVTGLFVFRGVKLPLARDGALLLAVCAGFALGIQPLAYLAGGAVCPTCLLLASTAALVALGAGWVARREAQVDARLLLGAATVALVLTAGGAVWRGRAIVADDAARRSSALEAGGTSGPQIVLVAKDGCPYCRATLSDVLGDPQVLRLLQQTRGVEVIAPSDPRAAGIPGVPVLLGFDEQGGALGEALTGYPTLDEGVAWLERVLAAAAK